MHWGLLLFCKSRKWVDCPPDFVYNGENQWKTCWSEQ